MNVSLTPELERLVQDKVRSGLYYSSSEVIREGLRLLKERDDLRELKMKELKNLIAAGIKQAVEGHLIPGDNVFAALRKRHEKRTAKK